MRRLAVVAALACAACEGFATPPEPHVSVLRRTSDDCFALMNTDAPVDPALGISGQCSYDVAPMLFGGVDFVEVVVDYGPDVDFATTTHAPTPTVTLLVDGQPSSVPITITDEQRVGSRAFFFATFRAPATQSLDARVLAGVNPGFQTEVSTAFAIVTPPVVLALTDCVPGTACVFLGAVGGAHVKVSVAGDVTQTVTIGSSIDGVMQPPPSPPVMTEVVGDHTEHTTALAVPAAHDGAQWTISAQLDGALPVTQTATIQAPTIASSLSCDPTCALAAGDPVGLAIVAPGNIRPLEALVSTARDGVPQIVNASVTLVSAADGLTHGVLALDAPQAGTWTIDVTIAGYSAATIVETVR